jgi:hypothetical protein
MTPLLCLVGLSAAAVSRAQVVVVPVADVHSAPSEKSGVGSQAICGSNALLLVAREEWSRTETPEGHSIKDGPGAATCGPCGPVPGYAAVKHVEADSPPKPQFLVCRYPEYL